MTYDIYATPNNAFIPDVEVRIIDDFDDKTKNVWFSWRGDRQFLKMEIQDDGHFLITDTEYTEGFQAWLDENLADYDSLESMFEIENNPSNKQVYFVVAVEFDKDGKPTSAFLDDDRAKAVFGDDDVWNTKTDEWESVGDDNNGIYDNGYRFVKSLIQAGI